MKRNRNGKKVDDLRPEYDPALFRTGVRGKYSNRVKRGVNVVLLDRDVAVAFPNSEAVNDALRLLLKIAKSASK